MTPFRAAAGWGAGVLVLLSAMAGAAATQPFVPGTYRQLDTVTKKPLPDGNQLVIVAGKGGRLGFSVNAIRQTDASEGFVAGLLPPALPGIWSQTSSTANCRLTFEAVPLGLKVTQDASFGDCGFDAGVSASGTYGLVPERPLKMTGR